jgi:hypothetical protein
MICGLKPLGLDASTLSALVDKLVVQDGVQERLKGELHDATQQLYATRAEIKDYLSRAISLLEGKYGKTSPKLQEFGIAPRRVNPHKGPRAKVPAGNTPADNTPTAKPSVEA